MKKLSALDITRYEIQKGIKLHALKKRTRKDQGNKILQPIDWNTIEIQITDNVYRETLNSYNQIEQFLQNEERRLNTK